MADPLKQTQTSLLEGVPAGEQPKPLVGKFVVPPFSVLDVKSGYWTERKHDWMRRGLKGEEGREQGLLGTESPRPDWERGYQGGESAWGGSSTSIFDPVLCEIAYRWFAPENAHILDPFAGGSTRGLVAAYLGHWYTGIEIRPEQVEANKKQAAEFLPNTAPPEWIVGDSKNLEALLKEKHPLLAYDLVFTCPPYYDLEVYSESDLSALPDYGTFLKDLASIYAQCVNRLKQDRFFIVVVGEIRDKKTGVYRNFVGANVLILTKLGLKFYNEAILVTPMGSLPIRTSRNFPRGRKLGKAHQNVLVFVKGTPELAVRALPREIEFEGMERETQAPPPPNQGISAPSGTPPSALVNGPENPEPQSARPAKRDFGRSDEE